MVDGTRCSGFRYHTVMTVHRSSLILTLPLHVHGLKSGGLTVFQQAQCDQDHACDAPCQAFLVNPTTAVRLDVWFGATRMFLLFLRGLISSAWIGYNYQILP